MKFLFVIDPIEKLNLKTDSTIEIMNESEKEKIANYYCETKDLYFQSGKSLANATKVSIKNKKYKKLGKRELNLDFFDLILMRKEPPYDLNYHYATMLLDKSKTKVLNNPQGLRNANEKLVILNFPKVIPNTIVTKSTQKIKQFLNENKKIVVKPIDLFGGKGIIVLDSTKNEKSSNKKNTIKKINNAKNKNQKNIETKIKKITNNGTDYVICQEFMESVYEGDKRIILLNGEPLGGILRIPKKGDFRANMAIGGTPKKLTLSKSDKRIISAIKPYLKKEGLVLVGVDVVKDKLIEINVTCPTGIVQVKEFDKKNITKKIVDYFKKQAKHKQ